MSSRGKSSNKPTKVSKTEVIKDDKIKVKNNPGKAMSKAFAKVVAGALRDEVDPPQLTPYEKRQERLRCLWNYSSKNRRSPRENLKTPDWYDPSQGKEKVRNYLKKIYNQRISDEDIVDSGVLEYCRKPKDDDLPGPWRGTEGYYANYAITALNLLARPEPTPINMNHRYQVMSAATGCVYLDQLIDEHIEEQFGWKDCIKTFWRLLGEEFVELCVEYPQFLYLNNDVDWREFGKYMPDIMGLVELGDPVLQPWRTPGKYLPLIDKNYERKNIIVDDENNESEMSE